MPPRLDNIHAGDDIAARLQQISEALNYAMGLDVASPLSITEEPHGPLITCNNLETMTLWGFELTTTFSAGQATADQLDLDGNTTGNSITVDDFLSLYATSQIGDKGAVLEVDGAFKIVELNPGTTTPADPVELFAFTTTTDMNAAPAGEATADIKNKDTLALVIAGQQVIDITDNFKRALSGANGICLKITSTYYVIECQQKAEWLTGFVNQSQVLDTDLTFLVDVVNVAFPTDGQSPGATLTVNNFLKQNLTNNDPVVIFYSETFEQLGGGTEPYSAFGSETADPTATIDLFAFTATTAADPTTGEFTADIFDKDPPHTSIGSATVFTPFTPTTPEPKWGNFPKVVADSKGLAVMIGSSYYAVEVQQDAEIIRAEINVPIAYNDARRTVPVSEVDWTSSQGGVTSEDSLSPTEADPDTSMVDGFQFPWNAGSLRHDQELIAIHNQIPTSWGTSAEWLGLFRDENLYMFELVSTGPQASWHAGVGSVQQHYAKINDPPLGTHIVSPTGDPKTPTHGSAIVLDPLNIWQHLGVSDIGLCLEDNGNYIIISAEIDTADDGKVKVDAADTLDYLEDQFSDLVTSQLNASLDLTLDVEQESGQLTIFVDASDITGHVPATKQRLGHSASGGFEWQNVDATGICNDLTQITGYVFANQQVLTHDASGGCRWVDTDVCP